MVNSEHIAAAVSLQRFAAGNGSVLKCFAFVRARSVAASFLAGSRRDRPELPVT